MFKAGDRVKKVSGSMAPYVGVVTAVSGNHLEVLIDQPWPAWAYNGKGQDHDIHFHLLVPPPPTCISSLEELDTKVGGLMGRQGVFSLSSGAKIHCVITAVDFCSQKIHMQSGLAESIFSVAEVLTRFTFDPIYGIDLGQTIFTPNHVAYKTTLITPPHTCTDNRKTYDSGWSRYDYCSVCDQKIKETT